jgi:uncharacterized membrane protein
MNKPALHTAIKTAKGDAVEISSIAFRVVVALSIPAFIIAALTGFHPVVISATMILSWIVLVFACFIAGEYQALTSEDQNIEPESAAEDIDDARTRARLSRDFDGERIKHSK